MYGFEVDAVEMATVPAELPAGIVTEAGIVTPELSELRLTVMPPVGALPATVTVPVEDVPPATELGVAEML